MARCPWPCRRYRTTRGGSVSPGRLGCSRHRFPITVQRTSMMKAALGALMAVVLMTQGTSAQRPTQTDTAAARRLAEQRLGRSVSQSEIMERLRQSGLTRAQARARLQQAGYDPGLADQYFNALESGAVPIGEADQSFMEALSAIGVSTEGLGIDP